MGKVVRWVTTRMGEIRQWRIKDCQDSLIFYRIQDVSFSLTFWRRNLLGAFSTQAIRLWQPIGLTARTLAIWNADAFRGKWVTDSDP